MRRYILNRVGQSALVLWAAYTLSFILLSALPGDAVRNRIANPDAQLTPEAAQVLLNYYGLNRPLWEQYFTSLGHLLGGDLGFSLTNGQTVSALLADALPATLRLAGLALLISIALAIVIALVANYAPQKWTRALSTQLPALFASVPTFVVGILALQFFSFGFHLIPASDDGSLTALIAPAATLGILVAAPLSQVLITSIAATRSQPFVHVLAARGADERYIFRRGVLRNSSLPVLTLLGLACGELVAGSVVTEAVFARPGVGQLTVGAVSTQDLPVLQGVVLTATLTYVLVNLAVDVAYPFIDPRILVSRGGARRYRRPARRSSVAAVPLRPPVAAEAAIP